MPHAQNPVRVLIVDDSAPMRALLRNIMERDPRLVVVAEAPSAARADHLLDALQPDVMVLDVEMPETNGLEFLKQVMRHRPMPVVMCSAVVGEGTQDARRAHLAGAVDCIPKPKDVEKLRATDFCDRVFAAAHTRLERRKGPADRRALKQDPRIFLLGASTGGLNVLESILPELSTDTPPVVIAQHMPRAYLESMHKRLDANLLQDVDIVTDGEYLICGQVRFAPPGECVTEIIRKGDSWVTTLRQTDAPLPVSPSIDHLFLSAVPYARSVVATILTGLGDDGAAGLVALRQAGARTIGQSAQSCAVYGMPKAAKAAGGVETEGDVEELAALMKEPSRRKSWDRNDG